MTSIKICSVLVTISIGLSRQKFETLSGRLEETVTVSVHSVIIPRLFNDFVTSSNSRDKLPRHWLPHINMFLLLLYFTGAVMLKSRDLPA